MIESFTQLQVQKTQTGELLPDLSKIEIYPKISSLLSPVVILHQEYYLLVHSRVLAEACARDTLEHLQFHPDEKGKEYVRALFQALNQRIIHKIDASYGIIDMKESEKKRARLQHAGYAVGDMGVAFELSHEQTTTWRGIFNAAFERGSEPANKKEDFLQLVGFQIADRNFKTKVAVNGVCAGATFQEYVDQNAWVFDCLTELGLLQNLAGAYAADAAFAYMARGLGWDKAKITSFFCQGARALACRQLDNLQSFDIQEQAALVVGQRLAQAAWFLTGVIHKAKLLSTEKARALLEKKGPLLQNHADMIKAAGEDGLLQLTRDVVQIHTGILSQI